MIGCNSTDEELEERARDYRVELEQNVKRLESENTSLREEVRLLEAEKVSLECRIDQLEDKIQSHHEYEGY